MGTESSTGRLERLAPKVFNGSLKNLTEESVVKAKSRIINRWKKRQLPAQIFGVVRHAERADGIYAYYKGQRWTQTEDYTRRPADPSRGPRNIAFHSVMQYMC